MKNVGKQSLSWLLTLASLFSLLVVMPIPAQAETGESFFDDSTGVDITYTILTERRNTGTVEVSYVHFWNDVTLLYIPPSVTYNGKAYTVTGIGDGSLAGSPIKRIVMPDSIKRIGNEAFYGSELERIDIPEGVTVIEERAFSECSNLASVTLPNSVTSINENAFQYCGSLKSLEFSSTLKSIGNFAFSDCNSLASVILPGVTSIGDGAFEGCINLTNVIFPEVTSIGKQAFGLCDSLTSIEVPASLTSGDYAFALCESLANVILADGLTHISSGMFSGCLSLANITIPNSVIDIGDYAFEWCALTSVTIPDSVINIGDGAFRCNALIKFVVDANNFSYSSDEGILYNKEKTALLSYPSAQGDYKIPDGVTSIDNSAFMWCRSLTSIVIPDGATSIGAGAFAYCTSLTNIEIPNSVTSIGDGAFTNCESLTSIKIPDGVTRIGDRTFYGCIRLSNIAIPDGVTRIGEWAFAYCENFTSIEIPASVTSLGGRALSHCPQLRSVTFAGNAPSMEMSPFRSLHADAIAYVYPWADGFPAEGEYWIDGLMIKYRDVPATSLDTGAISMLASGCAANLPVNIRGDNLLGKELIFSIKNESGAVVYTSETFMGADNFSAILKLDKETLTLPAGIYTLEAAISSAAIASATIKIAEAGPELWLVEAAVTPYNDTNTLVVRFSESPFVRTFNGAVTVDGIAFVNPVHSGNAVYLPGVDVTANHTIKITGVKYPELFPSYSFAFTAEYMA